LETTVNTRQRTFKFKIYLINIHKDYLHQIMYQNKVCESQDSLIKSNI